MTSKQGKPAGPRILVVEDDSDVMEYMEVLLRLDDYEVTTARNGREALLALEQTPRPALILLDLMMPEMDGWTLLDLLRVDPALATIPVVVLSGAACSMPIGARDMLLKPSTPRQVLEAVGRQIGRERRAAPRFNARFPLIAEFERGTTPATALNLSRTGILFRSSTEARVGQPLALTLQLDAETAVRAESQVRHVAADQDGWRIGARFIAVGDGSERLDGVLREMERGSWTGPALG